MQTKNITISNNNLNIVSKIKKNSPLIIILIFFLFIIFYFLFISNFQRITTTANNISISDFKLNISTLSETASIIETERKSNPSLNLTKFGSDGKIINNNEINPDLKIALTNIADTNNDGNLSNDELSNLKIMKLKTDIYKSEFKTLQNNLRGADCNFKNYVVISQGRYSGTILYNGPLKFVDNENNRCFGLELLN